MVTYMCLLDWARPKHLLNVIYSWEHFYKRWIFALVHWRKQTVLLDVGIVQPVVTCIQMRGGWRVNLLFAWLVGLKYSSSALDPPFSGPQIRIYVICFPALKALNCSQRAISSWQSQHAWAFSTCLCCKTDIILYIILLV